MRTRLPGFLAAVILAVFGIAGSVAQAAVPGIDGKECVAGKGTVEYDSGTGLWTCVGGKYDGKPID